MGFVGGLRDAVRMLVRHPALSATAVTALALGIASAAIMFSVVHAVLLRGLPLEDGDRIMRIEVPQPASATRGNGASLHDYLDWRARQSSFEELAAYHDESVNLRGPDGPVRYSGARVTASAFAALRISPQTGRLFGEADETPGAAPTVILSHRVWIEVFGGSPAVVGDLVTVNGEAAEIIGVMPEGFRFPQLHDIWHPLRMNALELERGSGVGLSVFGTLRAGVSPGDATDDFTEITAQLHAAYPETSPETVPAIRSFTQAGIVDGIVPLFWAMLVIASLVLLIACANAANLLLLQAVARVRETGIRKAMGAHRGIIVSRMMVEATVLVLLGAVLGTGIAWVGITAFARAAAATPPPFWVIFHLDGAVLLFIVAVSVGAALLSGIPPAWKATGGKTGNALNDEYGGSSRSRIGRLSRWMVAGELAMSMGLLVAAGLMTRSLATLNRFDYGFDHESVFTARVTLAQADFPVAEDRRGFFRAVQERVGQLSDVESASIGSSLPGLPSGMSEVTIEGEIRAEDTGRPKASWVRISPGYFEAFGVGVLRGRDFGPADDADGTPVAIVNRSFASTHFGNNAIGRRLQVAGYGGAGPWFTVVGVVPDLYMEGAGYAGPGPEGVYTPLPQGDGSSVYLIARSAATPLSLTPAVRQAVISVDPDTPIYPGGKHVRPARPADSVLQDLRGRSSCSSASRRSSRLRSDSTAWSRMRSAGGEPNWAPE